MFAGTTLLLAVAAEAAEGAAKSEGLPQLDPNYFAPQLFWLAVCFALLLFIMSRIALPRVGDVIDERRDRVKRDLDAAGRLKAETDKALADYEKALADARGNASNIAKETRGKLAAETDAERQRVDAQLAVKLQNAEARIAETKSKAVSAIGEIATETARAVVAKLIGQDVSPDEIKKALQPAPGE
ncbi:F0F1 ATP synthase subunit B' [Hyphomicrobium sp.]|jgi:F-type H+-transporting ATPase subunit b|uniref:F0F1 ATP synthase subunit B family protein n=1 Tax=Hyphomicrobium sp. TaxID=82 RepID=UPI002D097629|nr:F0F1 ATP synthase subunit B' [Hyphomicrobium sp.]HVZ06165.1 F0F1 ATP synthase subunit B' [Hyphomicrobium sp.]